MTDNASDGALPAGAFGRCEICAAEDWTPHHHGAIRDGAFGATIQSAQVAQCGRCGVQRLAETHCPDDAFYETEAYRRSLGQGLGAADFVSQSDGLQLAHLNALQGVTLRGKLIADIGAAGGSFLDHVAGVAARTLAVEPARMYHRSLEERGHLVRPDAAQARDFAGSVDLAVSFHVIEHVADPRAFLADIGTLLASDGMVLISTPNRDDILMDLLPDDYPAFFYRRAHRWYFDQASLRACATQAGLRCHGVRCVHRYGLSNALNWLKERRPMGHGPLPGIEALADRQWAAYLESVGRGDTLYAWLSRA